jgi:DNA-binding NarL/FixJ family response regulator
MDVSMPKMNGLDAARIILREQPKTRVLIVSQNDPDIVRRQSVEANVHGFVAKSNLHGELIEMIERILSANGPPTIRKAS